MTIKRTSPFLVTYPNARVGDLIVESIKVTPAKTHKRREKYHKAHLEARVRDAVSGAESVFECQYDHKGYSVPLFALGAVLDHMKAPVHVRAWGETLPYNQAVDRLYRISDSASVWRAAQAEVSSMFDSMIEGAEVVPL